MPSLTIDRRFRGPPDSANGGYAAGLLAKLVAGPAEVTLHRPPPLERPLEVRSRADGAVQLLEDEGLIAVAIPARPELGAPDPVPLAEATEAAAVYPGISDHPFPGCFVCGPQRAPGDGLCIHPAPVPGRDVAAAPWIPHPSLGGSDGLVAEEFVWAALDCPSWFGSMVRGDRLPGVYVLGRLTARVSRAPRVGEPCTCVGWEIDREGRKLHTGSALFATDGTTLAVARAVWIRLRESA